MVKPKEAEYQLSFPDYEQPVNAWWEEWDEMTRKYNWVGCSYIDAVDKCELDESGSHSTAGYYRQTDRRII
jgi:hypothetical protein